MKPGTPSASGTAPGFTDPNAMQPAATENAGPARIVICVPTWRRNAPLQRCLQHLAGMLRPEGFRLSIIVADNDAEGGARQTIEQFRANSGLEIHYVIEPRRGLAAVRNRLLHEALARDATWIACIDDDEWPEPDWLVRHMESLRRHRALVSSGPVIQPETPGAEGRRRRAAAADGSTPRYVASNNVVFHSRLAAGQGLVFDPRFDFTGGEDFDFFEASRRLGNVHVWTGTAVVLESVAPGRSTLSYLFQRHFTGAITSVIQYRKWRGWWASWPHFLVKAGGKFLSACLVLACLPFPGRDTRLRSGVKKLANACGYLCGLCNLTRARYRPDNPR